MMTNSCALASFHLSKRFFFHSKAIVQCLEKGRFKLSLSGQRTNVQTCQNFSEDMKQMFYCNECCVKTCKSMCKAVQDWQLRGSEQVVGGRHVSTVQ